MDGSKRKISSLCVTFLYAMVVLLCVLRHEVWSDEAQVFLVCKNLSLFELFSHLVNEGHPSLFYLLVMPFAKLFDDIIFQKLICYFSSVISVFLIWRYLNFSVFTKIVLTVSAPFLYSFPVIARNYSLVPLLVISAGILYNKKEDHPILYPSLLALIANTHAIMFPFALFLGGEFVYKFLFIKKRKEKPFIIGAIILSAGLLALLVQLIGTPSSNCAINFNDFASEKNHLGAFVRVIMLFLYTSFDEYYLLFHKNYFTIYTISMCLLTIAVWLFSFIFLFKKSKPVFCLAILSIGAQFGTYIFLYDNFIFATRTFCSYMIILFCFIVLMQNQKDKKTNLLPNILLVILFGLTIFNGLKSYALDIFYDYSPSKSFSQYLIENINPKEADFFVDDQGYAIALAYYLRNKHNLYYVGNGKPLRYVRWSNYGKFSGGLWKEYFEFIRMNNNKKELYALVNFFPFMEDDGATEMPENSFELIYVTKKALSLGEHYKLYKYKG